MLGGSRSASLKSAVGLSCLSIMTSVCPASIGEQAIIARVGHQQALHEVVAAVCRDCRAKVKACATVGKRAATSLCEPIQHEESERLVVLYDKNIIYKPIQSLLTFYIPVAYGIKVSMLECVF